MFVKATNEQIDQYPYTVDDLRRDNPNVSFPKKVPEQMMGKFGMFVVHMSEAPSINSRVQTLSSDVQFIDGKWKQVWSVSNLPEDIASENVRTQRDKMLEKTDWMVIRSQETGTPVSSNWSSYRQALRDITAQQGFPYQVNWPVKP